MMFMVKISTEFRLMSSYSVFWFCSHKCVWFATSTETGKRRTTNKTDSFGAVSKRDRCSISSTACAALWIYIYIDSVGTCTAWKRTSNFKYMHSRQLRADCNLSIASSIHQVPKVSPGWLRIHRAQCSIGSEVPLHWFSGGGHRGQQAFGSEIDIGINSVDMFGWFWLIISFGPFRWSVQSFLGLPGCGQRCCSFCSLDYSHNVSHRFDLRPESSETETEQNNQNPKVVRNTHHRRDTAWAILHCQLAWQQNLNVERGRLVFWGSFDRNPRKWLTVWQYERSKHRQQKLYVSSFDLFISVVWDWDTQPYTEILMCRLWQAECPSNAGTASFLYLWLQ